MFNLLPSKWFTCGKLLGFGGCKQFDYFHYFSDKLLNGILIVFERWKKTHHKIKEIIEIHYKYIYAIARNTKREEKRYEVAN